MSNNEECIHGGVSPVVLLNELHHSQAGSGRHKCPTCAYERGFLLGSSKLWQSYEAYTQTLIDREGCIAGSIASTDVLVGLGENQGGAGRHKCTNCAFMRGFKLGLLGESQQELTLDLVSPPNITKVVLDKRKVRSKKTNFLDLELENKKLGDLGELFVLKAEKFILNKLGKTDLANRVKHISVDIGDGLGYDILSYDSQGNEKYIEVKTTRGGIAREFYLTRNELNFSMENASKYFLYRLFDFDFEKNINKFYLIEGDLSLALSLSPVLFLASPN